MIPRTTEPAVPSHMLPTLILSMPRIVMDISTRRGRLLLTRRGRLLLMTPSWPRCFDDTELLAELHSSKDTELNELHLTTPS